LRTNLHRSPLNTGALSFAARSQVSRSNAKQQPRREHQRRQDPVGTSANLGVELALGDIKSRRRPYVARRTSTSFWRLPHIITAGGQAVVSSRRNRDIKEQETGVDLALKLPQIVQIVNYARGQARAKDSFILRL
jgi:hypothetical protein